jgi:hypothetical protein
MSHDEWDRDGNCDNCRKKAYCGKPCKMHENYTRIVISNLVLEGLEKRWEQEKP